MKFLIKCQNAIFMTLICILVAVPAIGKTSQNSINLTTDTLRIKVTPISENTLHVQAFPKDKPADPQQEISSWAVEPNSLENKNYFQPIIKTTANEVILTVKGGRVAVQKNQGQFRFYSSNGELLTEDSPTIPTTFNGASFSVTRLLQKDEHFFGLGDKSGPLDHRGQSFVNWNTDAYGWGESTDPLYKTIPFFISLRKGHTYGTFLDNTWRSFFDFGKQNLDSYTFGAEGGALDYYFFFGASPKDIIQAYTELTGRAPLPPLWSLGYQQCRYSYPTEKRVREVAQTFRVKKIPADVIYLDIDYQDGNRPFTVDRQAFPAFEKMISDLRLDGFSIIAITDLHLKKEKGYKPYDEGSNKDLFVKNPDGSTYVGRVWPGDSVFPEFTLTEARRWWGTLYQEFDSKGVRGFWNDMNEPAIFERTDKTMPLDTRHRLDDGRTISHRGIHNVYGMLNSRATYEGLLKLQGEERPFVLTRATYSGGQKYAATWTGDNSSTWTHMRLMLPTLLSLGVSGFPLVGADIGGFVDSPSPDLLTRWLSLGSFTPIDRNHTSKGTRDQEPWVHGPEHEAIRRHFIEARYQLLPYIYTVTEESTRTGIPIMRPLFLEYPKIEKLITNDREFLLGSALLVLPKVFDTSGAYTAQLPPGDWYDYWTGKLNQGDKNIELNPKLDELPVYVREGSIIPEQSVVQSTNEIPQGPLEIKVYPGHQCSGSAYFDDGHTFKFKSGNFARLAMNCREMSHGFIFKMSKTQGSYVPWFSQLALHIFKISKKPKRVLLNSKVIPDWSFDPDTQSVKVQSKYYRKGLQVEIEL